MKPAAATPAAAGPSDVPVAAALPPLVADGRAGSVVSEAGGTEPREEPRGALERLIQWFQQLLSPVTSSVAALLASAKPIVPEDREDTAQVIAFVLFSMVVQAVLGTLVAHTYLDTARVQPEVDMAKRGADLSTWNTGLFDCLRDPKICLCSFCCPCLRWADSLHTMGIMSFWAAFWLSMACIFLIELTYGLFWLMLLFGLVHFRQRLRKKFKMESSGNYPQLNDFLRYACCLPCVIAQDARHIEEACRSDHPAVLSGVLLQYEA